MSGNYEKCPSCGSNKFESFESDVPLRICSECDYEWDVKKKGKA